MAGSLQSTKAAGRFYAHARGEDRHITHLVPLATDPLDAAMRFVEHWVSGDDAREVSIIVRDGETGHEQCFLIDLGSGEAEPCA